MGSLSAASLLLALLGALLLSLSTTSHGLAVRENVRRSLELVHHVRDDDVYVPLFRRNAKPEVPLTRTKRFKRQTTDADEDDDEVQDASEFAKRDPGWRPGPEQARIRRHAQEEPLKRVKRLKRDLAEPQLNRVKRQETKRQPLSSRVKRNVAEIGEQALNRVKRGSDIGDVNPDEPALLRQKRFKRSIPEPEVFRTKRIDRTDEEDALQRVKRFKRDISFAKRGAELLDDFDQREMTPEKLRASLERVKRFRRSADIEEIATEEKTPEIRRTAKSQRDKRTSDTEVKSDEKEKMKNRTSKFTNETDVIMADKQPARDQKKATKKKHRAKIGKDIHRSKKAEGEGKNVFKRERTHLRKALTKDEKELEKLYHMQRSKRTSKGKNKEEQKDPLETAVKSLEEKRDRKNITKGEAKSTSAKSRGHKKRGKGSSVYKLKQDIARFKRLRREIFHDLKLKQNKQKSKSKRLIKGTGH